MVPPGESGLVVPCRSPDQLAIAMEELLKDAPRRLAMGVRGRQRAVLDFPEDKYLERHLQMIRAVENGEGSDAKDYSARLRQLDTTPQI